MSIPFDDIVSDHGTGNAYALKSMIIVHSYQLDYKPDTSEWVRREKILALSASVETL